MKRFFLFFCLAVATLGLSNCTTYVEDSGYASSRPIYRGSSYHHRGSYHNSYNNSRYNRYSSNNRHHDHDRDRSYVSSRSRRGDSYRRSAVNTRIRATVDAPVRIYR